MLRHHRRSIRLKDYDDTQTGAYFVTLCTHERGCVFGDIVERDMVINAWGEAVTACGEAIPTHFSDVMLDAFVVIPNHIHGIVVIHEPNSTSEATVGARSKPAVAPLAPLLPPPRSFAPLPPFPQSLSTMWRGKLPPCEAGRAGGGVHCQCLFTFSAEPSSLARRLSLKPR